MNVCNDKIPSIWLLSEAKTFDSFHTHTSYNMLQSDVAFTRLSLSSTYLIFREKWLLFLTVAAAAFVLFILFLITFGRELGEDAAATGETFDFSGDLLIHLQAVLTKLIIEWIFQTLVGISAQAAIAFTVAQMYTERLSSLKECVKKSVQRFCNIFQVGLLYCCRDCLRYLVRFVWQYFPHDIWWHTGWIPAHCGLRLPIGCCNFGPTCCHD
jgi:hypothetical protein